MNYVLPMINQPFCYNFLSYTTDDKAYHMQWWYCHEKDRAPYIIINKVNKPILASAWSLLLSTNNASKVVKVLPVDNKHDFTNTHDNIWCIISTCNSWVHPIYPQQLAFLIHHWSNLLQVTQWWNNLIWKNYVSSHHQTKVSNK